MSESESPVSQRGGTYELRIEFAGMCLFVHDPDENVMHVLMPRMTHVHNPQDQHVARGFVHDRYVSKIEGEGGCETGVAGWHCTNLQGQTLDLTAVGNAPLEPSLLGNDIIHLTRYLQGRRVPRRMLDGSDTSSLMAHVRLASGGLTRPNRGARWTLPGCRGRRMAISGHWVIPGLAGSLTLQMGSETWELTPQGGRIEIAIFHAPADETPDAGPIPLPSDAVVHHFASFYSLLDYDYQENEIPTCPTDIPTEFLPRGDDEPMDALSRLGRRATCFMAQADAETTGSGRTPTDGAADASNRCDW